MSHDSGHPWCVRSPEGKDRRVSRTSRDPAADLRAIAFQLERALEPSYRVKAFRTAASVVDALPVGELETRSASGRLTDLPGIGKATAGVITESMRGEEP